MKCIGYALFPILVSLSALSCAPPRREDGTSGDDSQQTPTVQPDGGSTANNANTLPEYCDPTPIFEKSCSTGLCHESKSGQQPEGLTDLFTEGVAERLLDVPAEYPGVDGCPDEPDLLINTADLEQSLMWKKLNNTQICGEGMPAPYPRSQLSDEEMSCIYAWMSQLVEDVR